jgi:aminoglycoside phosphotransferase (APT) family kinase protein
LIVHADLPAIADCFGLGRDLARVEPLRRGHIHDSYVVTRRSDGRRYLVQRINQTVFAHPEAVVENIRRVTEHLRRRLERAGTADCARRVLTLVPAGTGRFWHRDQSGAVWRVYRFIEHTRTHSTADTPDLACAAGRAFGAFQRLLADLPATELSETIAHFHNTPVRYAALEAAVAADGCGRAAAAGPEIDFSMRRRAEAGVLLELHARGAVPQRVVHNDAKIDNLLFDDDTGQALCVVDLDTVMPGLSLFDFGDMMRSMTCRAAEDEADLDRVQVDVALFAGLARGYIEATRGMLLPAERAHLVEAGRLITLEQGVRFLTDHLRGDAYYKVRRPDHNLARCRTQFRLVASIEAHADEMKRIVAAV